MSGCRLGAQLSDGCAFSLLITAGCCASGFAPFDALAAALALVRESGRAAVALPFKAVEVLAALAALQCRCVCVCVT